MCVAHSVSRSEPLWTIWRHVVAFPKQVSKLNIVNVAIAQTTSLTVQNLVIARVATQSLIVNRPIQMCHKTRMTLENNSILILFPEGF